MPYCFLLVKRKKYIFPEKKCMQHFKKLIQIQKYILPSLLVLHSEIKEQSEWITGIKETFSCIIFIKEMQQTYYSNIVHVHGLSRFSTYNGCTTVYRNGRYCDERLNNLCINVNPSELQCVKFERHIILYHICRKLAMKTCSLYWHIAVYVQLMIYFVQTTSHMKVLRYLPLFVYLCCVFWLCSVLMSFAIANKKNEV